MKFDCPNCGKQVSVDMEDASTRFKCPYCSADVRYSDDKICSGKIIAGFELQDLLGVGGMGEVWLAYQQTMDRRVAIKLLSPHLASDKSFVDNFMAEVKLAAKLDHPNIVAAFDAGVEDDIYYFAMSYVPGETFAARIAREKQLPESELLKVAVSVGKALQYAWDKFHILHRDVNPANIMLTPDGDIKLMDMGISKNMAEDDGVKEENLVGTPSYISPEQIRGDQRLDVRSDIYSLGATLYHLATGQTPFSGEDPYDILEKQLKEDPPHPRELNPEISDPFAVLIETMMAKDCEKRPASWQNLLADVQRVSNGQYPQTPHSENSHVTTQKISPRSVEPRRIKVSKDQLEQGHKGVIDNFTGRRKRPILPLLAVLLLLIGLAGVLALLVIEDSEEKQKRLKKPLVASSESDETGTEADAESDENDTDADGVEEGETRQQYEIAWQAAKQFRRENPKHYSEAIERFKRVEEIARNVNNSEYARLARNKIAELEEREKASTDKITEDRKEDGDGGSERVEKDKLASFLNEIAEDLSQGDLSEVLQKCSAFKQRSLKPATEEAVAEIKGAIEEIGRLDEYVAESFREDIGDKDVKISLDGDEKLIKVNSVEGKKVSAQTKKGRGYAHFTFSLRQLPFEERYARLEGRLDPTVRSLYAGIYHYRSGERKKALEFFKNSGILSDALTAHVEKELAQLEKSKARRRFARILNSGGIQCDAEEIEWSTISNQVNQGSISSEEARNLKSQLEQYLQKQQDSEFVSKNSGSISNITSDLETIIEDESESTPWDSNIRVNPVEENRFYKPIREARRASGRKIYCNPMGKNRGVIPERVEEELTHKMVLVLQKGDYKNRTLKLNQLNDIVIETEEGVENCDLVLRNCERAAIRDVELATLNAKDSSFVLVDSQLQELSLNNSSGLAHNSRIQFVLTDSELTLDHTLVGQMAVRNTEDVLVRNSILYGEYLRGNRRRFDATPCFRFYLRDPPKITLKTTLIFTTDMIAAGYRNQSRFERSILGPGEEGRTYARMSNIEEFVKLENTKLADPKFVAPEGGNYKLKRNSPAKRSSFSGKDLGPSPDLKPLSF